MSAATAIATANPAANPAATVKRRGRKPGSKNAPKMVVILRDTITGELCKKSFLKDETVELEFDYDNPLRYVIENTASIDLGRIILTHINGKEIKGFKKIAILSGTHFERPIRMSRRQARAQYIEDNGYDVRPHYDDDEDDY